MDGGAWWAAVHGVAKSRTRLSDFTFTSSSTILLRLQLMLKLPHWKYRILLEAETMLVDTS